MSGGGGKGGSQTVKTEIPAWLGNAARGNMARADEVSSIGYTPYYGPDVAALTPDQIAAQNNNRSAAAMFGLDPGNGGGLPTPQTFANGVQGYSSGPGYDAALAELKARSPGQFNMLTGMFVNPITGAAPTSAARAPVAAAAKPKQKVVYVGNTRGSDR
jgi:hypothetical protein